MTGEQLAEPDSGLSAGAAFLVNAIENARVSELQQAFRALGWAVRFDLAEDAPATEQSVEWGVQLEDGMVLGRPDRGAALQSLRGVTVRSGSATLVSRTVTRTEWAEASEEARRDG